ncbi:MAG: hypothetical protein ACPLUL_08690 [Thermanaerothrix sp.]|uniref:Uncharacterized protein n=1 Tax=Thermanaerothrix solaris TaxID=3058434 RepID=A0ABU3NNS4_9CHLR|nr:hypothetical protein [Thermanaerothrix sp. 4228-RoL]MDT8898490.1 hypothetical protein [Thermanaerothrix sp. 4228-RoL]
MKTRLRRFTQSPTSRRHTYPRFWEKAIPVFLVLIGVAILILLGVILAVVLGWL